MSALFERQWFPVDRDVDKNSFSLMTYNILNDYYTQGGYVYVKPELMLSSRRYPLIAKEVVHYDPDIVCMQEIGKESFDTMNKALSQNGYTGLHAEKSKGDGLATFYKSKLFEREASDIVTLSFDELKKRHLLKDSITDEVETEIKIRVGSFHNALFVKLKDKESNHICNIGNTHTVWGFYKYFDVQCVQLTVALDALLKFSDNGNEPHIMCGDFNTSPAMPTYRWIMEGYLTEQLIKDIETSCTDNGKIVDIASHLKNSIKHKCNLQSCYMKAMNEEPAFTSCEVDSNDQYDEQCLDFIFFNDENLRVVKVLQPLESQLIDKRSGLPNEIIPSDHISIATKMGFRT